MISTILKSSMIMFALLGYESNVSSAEVGDPVKCEVSDKIVYRYTLQADGTPLLRGFPSEAIADSCSPSWRAFAGGPEIIDCTGIAIGKPATYCLTSGTSVKCSPNDPTVYYYVIEADGTAGIRGFRSQEDADSCDLNWRDFDVIDCAGLVMGPPMETCSTPAATKAPKSSSKQSSKSAFEYSKEPKGTRARRFRRN